MLITNQVPFIAQCRLYHTVGYESVKYLLYQELYNTNLDKLTSKVLRVHKITNTKHVSIKH